MSSIPSSSSSVQHSSPDSNTTLFPASTTASTSETKFYDDVEEYINSLQEKYREKTVIKKHTCDKILKALSLEKGKCSDSLSTNFVYWCRQKFIIVKLANVDVVCCAKNRKPVCVYEALFTVIKECHESISHGGRDKTLSEINSHYSWVPKVVVEIYLKSCVACQVRKPLKQPVVSKPIISLGVMTRLQIDLIDMRTRPDVISST
ncbi:unnamed protein product, partial [Didymodactylos carnosus]